MSLAARLLSAGTMKTQERQGNLGEPGQPDYQRGSQPDQASVMDVTVACQCRSRKGREARAAQRVKSAWGVTV